MKKLLPIITIILFSSCTVSPVNKPQKPELDNNNTSTGYVVIDTNLQKQAQFKQAWLTHTKDIIRGSYSGEVDIWGGGLLHLDLWFEDRDLWDSMIGIDNQPYVLHNLLETKASFIDERTAVMIMPSSASYKLAGTLYVVRISNDTIYRTESPNGFNHIDQWDGKTVYTNDITPIAYKK